MTTRIHFVWHIFCADISFGVEQPRDDVENADVSPVSSPVDQQALTVSSNNLRNSAEPDSKGTNLFVSLAILYSCGSRVYGFDRRAIEAYDRLSTSFILHYFTLLSRYAGRTLKKSNTL